ncbi:ferric reductase-like transmembrane domain-containing protein [soil metagenome]
MSDVSIQADVTERGRADARFRQRRPDYAARYRRRARLADVLVGAVWVSGGLAVGLFLIAGGLAQFHTLAGAVTALGIIAGLIGTDLILVMLILAARVPVIDRVFGHDRAMSLHRSLGKPSLYLLLGHGALLLIGYGMAAALDPIAEIASMWAVPDMPLAFVGIGLLLVVVVTSLIAVRRKFSYEGWHLVHLLSYAAVLVAVPHQLSVGGVLADGSLGRAYWTILYVLAFGAVVFYRVAEPLISSLRHRLRVDHVETIAPGVVSIHLSGRRLRSLGSIGGQYFVWRFWTGTTWWHSHPISLSAVPTEDNARITVRYLGTGSRALAEVPAGTRVSIEGPYGLFTEKARTAPFLAVLVAGIGVTPVRALLEQSQLAPGEATIALRASDDNETYLWDEIREIADRKGARFYTLIGPRSRRRRPWLPAADAERGVSLRNMFPRLDESDLYLCGPSAWLDLAEAEARATGMPSHRIHAERFDW